MSLFTDAVQGLAGVTGVDKLAGVTAAGFLTITDGKMWRSLGWIVLGLVFLIFAVLLIVRREVGPVAATAAKAAVL